jgi:squalene-associated FAD-dependent desaturase
VSRSVVVVGGGLAGITAALACADDGADVVLLERRLRLGGLTWSFRRHGLWFDNGQHVFLRCCTAYRDLLARIGAGDLVHIQDRLALPVLSPAGRTAWIRRSRLPAPLHLGPSLLRYGHLPVRQRAGLLPAAVALRRLDPDNPRLDGATFGSWLAEHGQGRRAVDALWDLITVPTVNLHAEEASLALAARVFRTGLLDRADAGDIGWSNVPLQHLHGDTAARALAQAGVEVVLGAPVSQVVEGGAGLSVRTAGRTLEADVVVVAAPPDVATDILPAGLLPPLDGLGSSAIVNVHLVLDRQVTDHVMAAAVDSPVQFLFDRTEASGLGRGRGQCLAVSLSAADAYLPWPTKDLVSYIHAALRDLLPGARQSRVVDASVTRERQATFRGTPGTRALRPATTTAVPGLLLAGAWTDTGWPATMESAARSGLAAGVAALARSGPSPTAPRADAPSALTNNVDRRGRAGSFAARSFHTAVPSGGAP